MPRDRSIDDGRRSIEVLLPHRIVNELDRPRFIEGPYRSRSSIVLEALESYLRAQSVNLDG